MRDLHLKRNKGFFLVLLCIPLVACQSLRQIAGDYDVVSLHQPVWQYAWTETVTGSADRPPHAPMINRNVRGDILRVNGLEFNRGISVGGDAVFIYTPRNKGAWLQMMAGIDECVEDEDAEAELDIRGNGATLFSTTLIAGEDPLDIEIPLEDVTHLCIEIRAESNVVTDILHPRLVGEPGLRTTIETGREEYRNAVYASPRLPSKPVRAINNAVVFSGDEHGYPHCLIMTNSRAAVIIAPHRRGHIVFFGPTLTSPAPLTTGAIFRIHPRSRRVPGGRHACPPNWKWRMEQSGTLRLLSPPDPVYGVRYSRTYYFIPGTPVLRVASLVKNVSPYDISWSLGRQSQVPDEATLIIPREKTAPGYSLTSPPDYGISTGDEYVFITPAQTWRMATPASAQPPQIISSRAHAWWCSYAEEKPCMGVFPADENTSSYYPYDGVRSRVATTPSAATVTLFSEITRLGAGAYSSVVEYWTCSPPAPSSSAAVKQLHNAVTQARDSHTSRNVPGRPTGRTLD